MYFVIAYARLRLSTAATGEDSVSTDAVLEDITNCTFSSCYDLCKAKGVMSYDASCLNWTDNQGHVHVECCCPRSAAYVANKDDNSSAPVYVLP